MLERISQLMKADGWQTLVFRKEVADLNLYFRIISGNAAVNLHLVVLYRKTQSITQKLAVRGTISTYQKKLFPAASTSFAATKSTQILLRPSIAMD